MSFSYNSVPIPYPRTVINRSGPERDQGNADELYTTIHIQVEGVINPQTLPTNIVQNAADAGGILAYIRHLLNAPRKALYYDLTSIQGSTGTSPILNIPDGRDDAGGPWPDPGGACNAVYTTAKTILVTWSGTVKIRDCSQGSTQDTTSQPLSLRWEDSISFDKYFKATYRRTGTCVISSRSIDFMDDVRRDQIAPAVAPGFARSQSSYTISRDGLRCDFVFVDEQMRYAPPYPAVDMDITQSESLPLLGGIRHGDVSVSMVGQLNAKPKDLYSLCFWVGWSRVMAAGPLSSQGKVIGDAVFSTHETKDGVRANFSVRYKIQPPGKRTQPQFSAATWANLITAGAGFAMGSVLGKGAQPTQQGKDPTKAPIDLAWVGAGTGTPTKQNPTGFAPWANPTGSVVQKADGVPLAPAIKLFAALLRDPCGANLDTTPYATGVQILTGTVNNGGCNTPAGGNSTDHEIRSFSTAQLSATLSNFSYDQYPTTLDTYSDDALYVWDGQPAVYDYWQCQNEYIDNPGKLVMPVCNPTGVNIQVNPNSAMLTLRRRWVARRTGAPPRLPPAVVNLPVSGEPDPNWVYIGGLAPAIRELGVAADGVSITYEASGIYEFEALNVALTSTVAEIPPFLNTAILKTFSTWFNDAILVSGGGGIPGGSGSSPLGGGGLINPVPN